MSRRATDELLLRAFAKFDKVALGIAVGVTSGLGIFAATVLLLLRGGWEETPGLGLLGQYFIGYDITWMGAFVGFAYSFVAGFALGFCVAAFRNGFVFTYLAVVRAREERRALLTFLDEM